MHKKHKGCESTAKVSTFTKQDLIVQQHFVQLETMSILKVWSEDECLYLDYEDEDEFFLVMYL